MSKVKRKPQAPKRRNFVKKEMDELHRPKTHQPKSPRPEENDLQSQLDDYFYGEDDEEDDSSARKEEFQAKLKGEEYDPDLYGEFLMWIGKDWFFRGLPRGTYVGDLWLDLSTGHTYVYDGSQFVVKDS